MPDTDAIQITPGDWNGNPIPDILRWAVRSVLGAPQYFSRSDTSQVFSVFQQEWLALARDLGFPPTKVQQWVQDDAALRLIVEAYCARAAEREHHLITAQD